MKLAFSALIGASVLTLHGAVAGIVGIPAALYDAMVLIQGPKAMTRMARPGVRLDTQGRDALADLESGPSIEFDPFGDDDRDWRCYLRATRTRAQTVPRDAAG